MESETYPALWHFLGAYLNQDWRLEYADERAALDDFLASEPTLAPRLGAEVARTLTEHSTDDELTAHLLALGADFIPTGPDGSVRAWLEDVRTAAS